jgi:UDP-N-acetylglucosamine--N-acetylmuramyl-(pentapeptide) pyrophosphoryl-undecaprenol N-acetylglucosamine transferase
MKKKLIITVGGTGGHIFPALGLAKQISEEMTTEILFVGGKLTENRFFDLKAFPFKSIASATFSSKNPFEVCRSLLKINQGFWESRTVIHQFKPDLVIGFGSYYTLPVLLAAKSVGVPFILHEANSIPGKVNKLLSRYAMMTGIHFPITSTMLYGKTLEVGMPLRDGYTKGTFPKEKAREYFQLDNNKVTILIFGGSQGAKTLNILCSDAFCEEMEWKSKIQILHFTGDQILSKILEEKYAGHQVNACVKSFESRMDIAWQAADLVISRAGAGTIAEEMEFEVPGILIPYPHATDNHQEKNADYMSDIVGGGVMILERKLTSEKLKEEIYKLLENDNYRLCVFKDAIRKYKAESKKENLLSIIKDII